MSRFLVTAFGLLVALFALPAFGQTGTPPSAATAASSNVMVPSYSDTAEGLQKFMREMMKFLEDGDSQQFAAYSKSLLLPNPDDWFNAVFGKDLGPRYIFASEKQRAEIATSAAGTLR